MRRPHQLLPPLRTPSRAARLLVLLLAACDQQRQQPEAHDASPPPSAIAPATPPMSASASPEPAPSTPLELQELTFTSEVKSKEPADVLLAAEPGKRVWVHLRLRNRGEETRKIHLEFRVNDDKRTTIDLNVSKSWSYRTWAYNTLLESDRKGTVSLKVTDDDDRVLADTTIPIASKARTKPYVKAAK